MIWTLSNDDNDNDNDNGSDNDNDNGSDNDNDNGSDNDNDSDNDNGSENITKKMNLRSFKLYRVYLEPAQFRQMLATFPGVEFLRAFIPVQIEKGKFVVACPLPP